MDRPISLEKAVEAFGGFSGLARAMGIGLSTVHAWARRTTKSKAAKNREIPAWRAEQIRALAKKRKLDVYKDAPRKKKRPRKKAA